MTESNYKQVVEMQNENYQKRIGLKFGIFEVVGVEYDWELKKQIWTVRCTRCGEETKTANGRDWSRGKGRSLKACKNCKKIEKEKKEANKIIAKNRINEKQALLGKEVCGWKVEEVLGNSMFLARCLTCGNTKQVSRKEITSGTTIKCKHPDKTPVKIGQRFGNLTAVEICGKYIKVRCDCGKEKLVAKHSLISGNTITCGTSNCPYRRKNQVQGATYVLRGREFEEEYCKWLNEQGFMAETTKASGDYGVDIIVTRKNGEKTAVQLKYHKKNRTTGVEAVQQVYAGGMFFDCTNFVVISTSGFTDQAINMAKKLGVYLSEFDLKGNAFACGNNRIVYEIDGKKITSQEVCKQAGISRNTLKKRLNVGMSIKDIASTPAKYTKQTVAINGEKHTISEWCKIFGFSTAFIKYRIDVKGMDAYTALTAEKQTNGRPSKIKKVDFVK